MNNKFTIAYHNEQPDIQGEKYKIVANRTYFFWIFLDGIAENIMLKLQKKHPIPTAVDNQVFFKKENCI